MATPTVFPTPAGRIGERSVTGVVIDHTDAPRRGVAGARVTCVVAGLHPETASCVPRTTRTGVDGRFAFTAFLHDTDRITIAAERAGSVPAMVTLDGLLCAAACPAAELVLVPRVLLPWVIGR